MLKEAMSYNMIRSIYYSYFQSRLKYGIIFWGSAKYSIKVCLIQKKVMRLIAGVNRSVSCRGLFSEFKILTVPLLYILETLSFIKKLKDNVKFNSQRYEHNTRGKNKLYIQLSPRIVY
jgi:hypothetical protein